MANSAFTFKNVRKDEISAIVKNLNPEKALKSNDVPTRILKEFGELFPDSIYKKFLTPVLIPEIFLKYRNLQRLPPYMKRKRKKIKTITAL